MSSILIYQPLGLGDHIACSGIIREYAKKFKRIGLFCLPQNIPSVSFMFRDLTQVTVLPLHSHAQASVYIFRNCFTFGKSHYDRVLKIGSFNVESGIQYERQFYNSAGVPLEKMWESFYVERDQEREVAISAKLVPGKPYLFIHEDSRFPLKPERINSTLPHIRPDLSLTNNIFDYCDVLEHAEEIHVIDSSFMFLVDCLPYTNARQRLVVHRYARENMAWNLPILKKNWEILTKV